MLDYQYGTSKLPTASNPEYLRTEGRSLQGTNIHGPMLRGDFLYVRWRIRSTGQIYQDRVDLRRRLPMDLTGYQIHFVINGPQLFVYLISPEKTTGHCPVNEDDAQSAYKRVNPHDRVLLMYCYLKVTQIYPDRKDANNHAGATQ